MVWMTVVGMQLTSRNLVYRFTDAVLFTTSYSDLKNKRTSSMAASSLFVSL